MEISLYQAVTSHFRCRGNFTSVNRYSVEIMTTLRLPASGKLRHVLMLACISKSSIRLKILFKVAQLYLGYIVNYVMIIGCEMRNSTH